MLAGAGFGDDALLAHADGKQRLAEAVVDLVRAGVEEVFALEVDLGAAESFGQSLGEVERRGAAGVVAQERVEFEMEVGVGLGLGVGVLQFFERGDESFRDIAAAVRAEASNDALGSGCCHSFTLHRMGAGDAGGELLDLGESGTSRGNKSVEASRILFAGVLFDAAGDIDAPGMQGMDSLAHIIGMETAGEDNAQIAGFGAEHIPGARPVKCFAGAAG